MKRSFRPDYFESSPTTEVAELEFTSQIRNGEFKGEKLNRKIDQTQRRSNNDPSVTTFEWVASNGCRVYARTEFTGFGNDLSAFTTIVEIKMPSKQSETVYKKSDALAVLDEITEKYGVWVVFDLIQEIDAIKDQPYQGASINDVENYLFEKDLSNFELFSVEVQNLMLAILVSHFVSEIVNDVTKNHVEPNSFDEHVIISYIDFCQRIRRVYGESVYRRLSSRLFAVVNEINTKYLSK